MSKDKAERIVLAMLVGAVENLGMTKVALLYQEAVGDTGAIADDLFDVSPKREKQFRRGIKLIQKARAGAIRDENEDDDEEDCICAFPRSASDVDRHSKLSVSLTQKEFQKLLHDWTGLHFHQSSDCCDHFVTFKPKKLAKKLAKCDIIADMAVLLSRKTGGSMQIRAQQRGHLLPGGRALTDCSSAYIVTLR